MISNGKAKIENSIGSLLISIPSKKNWFALPFATLWLGGWFFGFTKVSSILFTSHTDDSTINGFLIFWLLGWTIGGMAIATLLLWGYFGKEVFSAKYGEVQLLKTVFGIGIKKKLDHSEIRNIRTDFANGNMFGSNRWAAWGLGPGKIKFDYGLKTYSFGLGVDDAEANHIAEIMTEHFKNNK